MGFKKEYYKPVYTIEDGSFLRNFYLPSLKEAVTYDRMAGYFSSDALVFALQGISEFTRNNGSMRLLVGDYVDEDEYEAIKEGYRRKQFQERFTALVENVLDSDQSEVFQDRLRLLSWMISNNNLKIKISLKRKGITHDKLGVLTDSDGSKIVFHGSANETAYGISEERNDESITAYYSWHREIYDMYARPLVKRFEDKWDPKDGRSIALDVPSEAYEKIRKYYTREQKPPKFDEELWEELQNLKVSDDNPRLPEFISGSKYALHDHQKEALKEWQANDFSGIFALATGSGKTITALHAVVKILEARGMNHVLTVAVPYQILAEQWASVMSIFNIRPVICYKSRSVWQAELSKKLADQRILKNFLAVIVVNATLAKSHFQELIVKVPKEKHLFIGDECHHHGSETVIKHLPDARYRIGLSATPWSAREEERKRLLRKYYGPVVATYGIDRALEEDVLCHYQYVVHPITLNNEETSEYEGLSKNLGQLYARKEAGEDVSHALNIVHMKRARLIGSAQNKFEAIKQFLEQSEIIPHTLFYCGDGSVESDVTEGERDRDVVRLARLLHANDWKTSRFTAEESSGEREAILENFKANDIDAIVAIRVLDEGFDIPDCQQAFLLASSRNERQFIQRRGRILRKSKNKTQAIIHDFIVLPNYGNRSESLVELVKAEMVRAAEFSRICANKSAQVDELSSICEEYGLDFEQLLTDVEELEFTKYAS